MNHKRIQVISVFILFLCVFFGCTAKKVPEADKVVVTAIPVSKEAPTHAPTTKQTVVPDSVTKVKSDNGIPLTEYYFSRDMIKVIRRSDEYGFTKDDYLTEGELWHYKKLKTGSSNKDFDMRGIENLIYLEKIKIYNKNISNFDINKINKCTSLKCLELRKCDIHTQELDLSNLNKISMLLIYNCNITDIEVSKYNKITKVTLVEDNVRPDIECIEEMPYLKELTINGADNIDLSNNPDLELLDIEGSLKKIDLSRKWLLKLVIDADISELDITDNKMLEHLEIKSSHEEVLIRGAEDKRIQKFITRNTTVNLPKSCHEYITEIRIINSREKVMDFSEMINLDMIFVEGGCVEKIIAPKVIKDNWSMHLEKCNNLYVKEVVVEDISKIKDITYYNSFFTDFESSNWGKEYFKEDIKEMYDRKTKTIKIDPPRRQNVSMSINCGGL